MDDREQAIFRQLAGFAGGATLEAIEAFSGVANPDSIDTIESLMTKSLVYVSVDAQGETRFSMLGIVREYALERLEPSPAPQDSRVWAGKRQ